MYPLFSFDKIPAGGSIVGRTDEIAAVLSALGPEGKSLALYGEARSGKETVVTEALERYRKKKDHFIVCPIDLLGIRTFDDFTALWRERMKACAEEVNRGALLPFDICIDEIAGNRIFDLPGIISNEAGTQVIIYFKEFQNLLRIEDESFHIEMLDRIWSRQRQVRYLMTGSFINAMKTIFEERKCFYGMCRTLELQPLDKQVVCNFIRSGDPNGTDLHGEALPAWEPWSRENPRSMMFLTDGAKPDRTALSPFKQFLSDRIMERMAGL